MTATWTSPRTNTTGELMTAAIMNTHVRDNLEYLYDRSESLITMAGAIRMHVADSLGGTDSHRLVFGDTTYTSWHLCNGDANIDGTGINAPDMRGKFVMGAGSTYAQGDTGGAVTHDVSHPHTGSAFAADATALTNHVHAVAATATGTDTGGTLAYNAAGATAIGKTDHYHNFSGNTNNPGSNPTHTHANIGTGATNYGGSDVLPTLPPYKAAYWFICVTA